MVLKVKEKKPRGTQGRTKLPAALKAPRSQRSLRAPSGSVSLRHPGRELGVFLAIPGDFRVSDLASLRSPAFPFLTDIKKTPAPPSPICALCVPCAYPRERRALQEISIALAGPLPDVNVGLGAGKGRSLCVPPESPARVFRGSIANFISLLRHGAGRLCHSAPVGNI